MPLGYRHILNLYKLQTVLLFKELYALEKIHGTSTNIKWKNGTLTFSSGGISHHAFMEIFDQEALEKAFVDLGHEDVEVYGEGYGGKTQKMSGTYGPNIKFVVFEVRIHDNVLNVPNAYDVATKLDLEFVHYEKIPATLEAIDAQRDADSVQAVRNGVGEGKQREGIVLRPLFEFTDNKGDHVIAKHKIDKFGETKTPRKVEDPAKLVVLEEAEAIALEWVTDGRLGNILSKIKEEDQVIENTGKIIKLMVEDVLREAKGEIIDSKFARKAISKRAGNLYRSYIKSKLYNS